MFTDKELASLHKASEYRKENGIKNLTYTFLVIRAKASGMVSLSIASDGGLSLSANIISIFWFLLRYFYITIEFVQSRSYIIEGLLSSQYKYDQQSILKDAIGASNLWLELKEDKLRILESACLKFIDSPENRTLLASHSCLPYDECIVQIIRARSIIKQIFRSALEELICRLNELGHRKYEDLLHDKESVTCMQNTFISNSQAGNLTDKEKSDEPKAGE